MSQSEQLLVFKAGSLTATNATPVVVSDVRIRSTSTVLLCLPSTRAGANAGVARVSAVADGSFTVIGGADDQSVYQYLVLSSPLFASSEQSAYSQL